MVENALEMAGVGYHHLESVYLGSNHPAAVVLAQGFRDSESPAVLLHCCWYDMCECGMYVQLDFKSAWNSLAHAEDMQILGDGWAASDVGAKRGEIATWASCGMMKCMYGASVAKGKADLKIRTNSCP